MNQSQNRIHPALLPANTPEDAARLLFSAKGGAFVATLNLELLARAYKDAAFLRRLQSADYRICDGIGAKLLLRKSDPTTRIPRIAGIDLGFSLLSLAARRGISVFLLGGKPGIADAARRELHKAYPELRIAGVAHGYFPPCDLPALRGLIRSSGAELLFVCMGSPLQEDWIAANRHYLPSVRLFLPLGGSLDVWAKALPRAPRLWRKVGMEWLWRILRQPSRILRLAASCAFFLNPHGKLFQNRSNLFQIE